MIKRKKERGQALVEFAFTLPILMMFVAGVFDFGRVFVVYAQASNSLRRAVREAPVIGYEGAAVPSYLDCENMADVADNVFGADNGVTVTVEYWDSDPHLIIGTCTNNGDIVDTQVENGDYVKVISTATVTPVLLAFIDQSFTFTFEGQRTIVKTFSLGAAGCGALYAAPNDGDDDYDGLCDGWELQWFGSTSLYIATDDPDNDGSNNGCEESAGSNPNDNSSVC